MTENSWEKTSLLVQIPTIALVWSEWCSWDRLCLDAQADAEATDEHGWPAGFFEETYGSLADDPLERLPQGEPEVRETIL